MKYLLIITIFFSFLTYAKTTTVSVNYEYKIEHKGLLTDNVLCVDVYDARPDGGDYLGTKIWFQNKYKTAAKYEKEGFKATLNKAKKEQCESSSEGTTPTIYVSAFGPDRIKASDVKSAMDSQEKSFVKRKISFLKSNFSLEDYQQAVKDAKEEALGEIFHK